MALAVGPSRMRLVARDPERDREAPYEHVEPRRHREHKDPSDFDRIAFAMRALNRLNPHRMKVAVYPAVSSLRVESGEDHRRGEGARWAIVGIPPDASREHIAYALVELAGVAGIPYAVQAILSDDGGVEA
jgi:hypothetical protein